MIIREVLPGDAPAITAIYNSYVTETTISFDIKELTVEEMSCRINNLVDKSFPYLVAVAGGEVVGFCYAHPWKERAAYNHTWETTIYLCPDHCHGGIGRLLMEKLTDRCRMLGAHALIACITGDNLVSIAFHSSLGFKQVSYFTEVGFKHGHWLDVVDMELTL